MNEIRLTLGRACCSAVLLLAAGGAAEPEDRLRIATFNVSLYGKQAGELESRLRKRSDPQISAIAEIIQRVRPDILLLNEFDTTQSLSESPSVRVSEALLLKLFQNNYLEVAQHASKHPEGPAEPLQYAFHFTSSCNTGVHSGYDLDRSGKIDASLGSASYNGDCWGYGAYPGQYGMAVLSRYPIAEDAIRTFQHFLWRDMPGARLPEDPKTSASRGWYPAEALKRFPLSSKSHWDVPIQVGNRTLHLLASHPTPPVYDGPEDRNGRRNHDEIRFWADYLGPMKKAAYISDDAGVRGGLGPEELFVVAGDLNSDPHDGDGASAIRLLLEHPRVEVDPIPSSAGGEEQAALQGGANRDHRGLGKHDTCDPPDAGGPGNLRLDYVLPSQGLTVVDSGVFWPEEADPLFALVGKYPFPSSDHRLVWIDVVLPPESTVSDHQDR